MKLVVNKNYGGFYLSDNAIIDLNLDPSCVEEIERDNVALISLIENSPANYCNDTYSELVVIEIPDDITDYIIDEYDGYERVIYVRNGKLHYA